MIPHPGKMNKVKGAFDKVVEWDKNLIKKCQDKFGWTDYQVVVISFAKGCLLYTSPSPRDKRQSRMPSSA